MVRVTLTRIRTRTLTLPLTLSLTRTLTLTLTRTRTPGARLLPARQRDRAPLRLPLPRLRPARLQRRRQAALVGGQLQALGRAAAARRHQVRQPRAAAAADAPAPSRGGDARRCRGERAAAVARERDHLRVVLSVLKCTHRGAVRLTTAGWGCSARARGPVVCDSLTHVSVSSVDGASHGVRAASDGPLSALPPTGTATLLPSLS